MHRWTLVALLLFVPSAIVAALEGAATPTEAYQALQKAAAKHDVDAIAAVLVPEERELFRSEVADSGADAILRRVPRDPLKITNEKESIVTGEVSGRRILFLRRQSRWYVAALFTSKEPVAVVQTVPRVRIENGEAMTVAPIHGAGMPTTNAIPASKAYELLRAKARSIRPGARLYTLDTGQYALSADGNSSGWTADFLTETPGELVTVSYFDGETEEPWLESGSPHRGGVPDADAVGYDTKKLYEETVRRAAGKVDPISRVTAALYRSPHSHKAIWLLNVYGDNDRIGTSVVFEAPTMEFSHSFP